MPKFPESALAHRFLDGLRGIEIGAAAHNSFGLRTWNVDYSADRTTPFKRLELEMCGQTARVDIVAFGHRLPFRDRELDFVLSSHVLEHFPDPILALQEWWRVIRGGGYIYMIVPHKDRTGDKDCPRTTLRELIERHRNGTQDHFFEPHFSIWITEDLIELAHYLDYPIVAVEDVDDKAGNGFTVVLEKPRAAQTILGRLRRFGKTPRRQW